MPHCTPSAPSARAASMPRPSAMPPAAMTGMSTAAHTEGTSAMVVSSPTWPPASVPSATTASAPRRSMRAASAADATTGTTLIPASFHMAMCSAGLPAPVVTTSMPRSHSRRATSAACGSISMTLAPKGLLVSSRAWRTWSSTHSSGAPPQAMMPRPPASLTAAARRASAMRAMAPWTMGASMPSSSVMRVLMMFLLLFPGSSVARGVRGPSSAGQPRRPPAAPHAPYKGAARARFESWLGPL